MLWGTVPKKAAEERFSSLESIPSYQLWKNGMRSGTCDLDVSVGQGFFRLNSGVCVPLNEFTYDSSITYSTDCHTFVTADSMFMICYPSKTFNVVKGSVATILNRAHNRFLVFKAEGDDEETYQYVCPECPSTGIVFAPHLFSGQRAAYIQGMEMKPVPSSSATDWEKLDLSNYVYLDSGFIHETIKNGTHMRYSKIYTEENVESFLNGHPQIIEGENLFNTCIQYTRWYETGY